jgi:hypothetical protein
MSIQVSADGLQMTVPDLSLEGVFDDLGAIFFSHSRHTPLLLSVANVLIVP